MTPVLLDGFAERPLCQRHADTNAPVSAVQQGGDAGLVGGRPAGQ